MGCWNVDNLLEGWGGGIAGDLFATRDNIQNVALYQMIQRIAEPIDSGYDYESNNYYDYVPDLTVEPIIENTVDDNAAN